MVVMTRVANEILLELKATFNHIQKFTYLFHLNEGKFPSSLIWHTRFGHVNYNILHLLKNNGVSILPNILKKFKKCIACILEKHIKQPFHDYTSRACRKQGLIH